MRDIIYIDKNLQQFKGNLHMHSSRSDGRLSYQDALGYYRDRGYSFCLMSDHEIYWDSPQMDTSTFLVLSGIECSVAPNPKREWFVNPKLGKSIHLIAIRDDSTPYGGPSFAHDEYIPRKIDTGIQGLMELVQFYKARNHIVMLNHPRWSRITPEYMLAIQQCFAVEVWNTASEYLETTGESEYEWDYCLQRGLRIFGAATDDTHYYAHDVPEGYEGYVAVNCEALSKQQITLALKEGKFYASTGPSIYDMRVVDGTLQLECSPAHKIRLVGADRYAPTLQKQGELLTRLDYKIDTALKYIRPEIVAPDGRKAWGPPVFTDDIDPASI